MSRMQAKTDGSGVGMEAPGAVADTTNYKVIEHPNVDAIMSAVILVVRDEINTLRAVGAIGLAALSVDDWKTKIAAKLP